ncbi:hypothetical protein M8J77_025026 [Diaphorina citri]|nr:hypothetical protein M8J77_025026 [Diaphorina citri]
MKKRLLAPDQEEIAGSRSTVEIIGSAEVAGSRWRKDDDARKRTEEGEGYSGIPVCREFPNENPNISDSLAYSTLE